MTADPPDPPPTPARLQELQGGVQTFCTQVLEGLRVLLRNGLLAQSAVDTVLLCAALAARDLNLDRTFFISASKRAWAGADHLVRALRTDNRPPRGTLEEEK